MKLHIEHKLPIIIAILIIGLLFLQPKNISVFFSTYLGKTIIIAIIIYYCTLSKTYGILALAIVLIYTNSYNEGFENNTDCSCSSNNNISDGDSSIDYSSCFTQYQPEIDFQTDMCYATMLKDSSGNPIIPIGGTKDQIDTYNTKISTTLNELKSKYNFSATDCDPCMPNCLTSVTPV